LGQDICPSQEVNQVGDMYSIHSYTTDLYKLHKTLQTLIHIHSPQGCCACSVYLQLTVINNVINLANNTLQDKFCIDINLSGQMKELT